MSEKTTSKALGRPLDVWTTVGIATYRQYPDWAREEKAYQFISARPLGYVIITSQGEPVGVEPLAGYVVVRPAGLQLSWHSERSIKFHQLSFADAETWNDSVQLDFSIISAQPLLDMIDLVSTEE